MAILVTGGAGFIGSHTCVEMLNAGYEVIVRTLHFIKQISEIKKHWIRFLTKKV